ncbi:MAG: hypothetical protein LBL27_03740, partial [Coriobacteriales bacterium]|nr:hypothetical protein [Coriobacteriales bacterium]
MKDTIAQATAGNGKNANNCGSDDFAERLARLRSVLRGSKRVVFFGGAGVSTESGIPDFRSKDGLYNQHYAYPPEVMLSRDFFWSHTAEFFRFHREKVITPALAAKPNAAHQTLAELEKDGHLIARVTQNIDGLHQAAGSQNVLELHGNIHRNFCEHCQAFYPVEELLTLLDDSEVPHCTTPGCDG